MSLIQISLPLSKCISWRICQKGQEHYQVGITKTLFPFVSLGPLPSRTRWNTEGLRREIQGADSWCEWLY